MTVTSNSSFRTRAESESADCSVARQKSGGRVSDGNSGVRNGLFLEILGHIIYVSGRSFWQDLLSGLPVRWLCALVTACATHSHSLLGGDTRP